MADDTGDAPADLGLDHDAALRMDFFELLRQIETPGHRFGRAGAPGSEPARLGQTARLAFAAADIAELKPGDPPQVAVNVIGLLGPEGPMPLHLTRWVLERLSNRWFVGDTGGATTDKSFLDFVNLLQHRMIALYWRAWAEAQSDIQVAHENGGRVSAVARALAGLGLPGSASGDGQLDNAKLRQATSLAQDVQSPDRLAAFLQTVLDVPVTITEFVGRWIEIPAHLQTRLGRQYAALGTGAVVGERVFDRQSRAEIRLGPLTLDQFTALLDNDAAWERLRKAVVFAEGKGIDYGIRLVLAPGEAPPAQLGTARLGRIAWLQPDATREADDLCFFHATAGRRERGTA